MGAMTRRGKSHRYGSGLYFTPRRVIPKPNPSERDAGIRALDADHTGQLLVIFINGLGHWALPYKAFEVPHARHDEHPRTLGST